jgi:mono/diheme cytochrome c family protein
MRYSQLAKCAHPRQGRLLAISVLFVSVFCIPVAALSVTRATDRGAVPPNRDIYVRYGCYECHGFEGQGGGSYGGPRIAPQVWPFGAFAEQVRRPRGSPFAMPAYSPRILSDSELKGIYDYLRAIRAPPPDGPQAHNTAVPTRSVARSPAVGWWTTMHVTNIPN